MNACKWQPGTVTLADGREVPSDSPEWLAECEARFVLDMPTKLVRLEYLDKIEKRRGLAARKAMENAILDLWIKRRNDKGITDENQRKQAGAS